MATKSLLFAWPALYANTASSITVLIMIDSVAPVLDIQLGKDMNESSVTRPPTSGSYCTPAAKQLVLVRTNNRTSR